MRLSLIEAMSRRDFLKKTGGATAAMAFGDPRRAASELMSNEFSGMSDEELRDTPESLWITKVPYARLLKILKGGGHENYHYGTMEMTNKLLTALQYGDNHKKSADVGRILVKAMKDAGLEGEIDEAMPNVVRQMSYIDFTSDFDHDMDHPNMIKSIHDHVDRASNLAKKMGLNIPKKALFSRTSENARNAIARVKEQRATNELRQKQKLEAEKRKPEKYEIPPDYHLASSMHQPFESKLNKILATIC